MLRFVVGSIGLTALLAAQARVPSGVVVTRDVRYAESAETQAGLQSLDVYSPEGATAAPILVFVHGGGWRTGDKANAGAVGEKVGYFTSRGWVFVSVNYRLSPAVRHPAHVEDVAAAIHYVRAHARDLGGDAGRVFVIGHSAGAHLTALVATDERWLAAHDESLDALRGVVLLDGAGYDLGSLAKQVESGRSRGVQLFESAFGPRGDGWLDASPIEHVAARKGIPPFLIVHAERRPGSAEASDALARALAEAGVSAVRFEAEGKDHAGVNRDLGQEGDALTAAVTGFLDRLATPVAASAIVDPRFAEVDRKLQELVAADRVPGLSLVVVTADRVVHTAIAGTGDLEVAIPIASATKIPTVTAFLTLVDRGLVELDAPVSQYLDDWPASAAAVTVRQLLSCTSGFGNVGRWRAMRAATLADSVHELTQAGPITAPGSEFRYSGTGFQVAGRIAEVVTGEEWRALFAAAVATPLGLTSFHYGDNGVPWLGGGASCSPLDYARLLRLHLRDGELDGQRVLSEKLTREMRKDHTAGLAHGQSPFPDGRGYGLAWWRTPPERENGEVVEFSDPGAFGATPWIDVSRGYGAVLVLHGEDSDRPPRGGMRAAAPIWAALRPLVQAAITR